MSKSSQFSKILKEAKRSRFDDNSKGTTVVRENHFSNNNEEMSFAKFCTTFSTKKGSQLPHKDFHQIKRDSNPIIQSEAKYVKFV